MKYAEAETAPGVSPTLALVILSTTAAIVAFIMSAVPVALPSIGRYFAMEAELLAWVTTALTFPQAAMLLGSGRLADIYGRKKIFVIGMFVYTIASFLCALATTPALLISYRLLQGLGGGLVFGTTMALLTSIIPLGERGRAFGINAAAVFVGISAGPALGGVMTQHLGWQSIFYLSGGLCAVLIVLTFWKLKGDWIEAKGDKFDLTGAIIFGISLMVAMYGLTIVPKWEGFAMVVAGALGLYIFVRYENRINHPIFNIKAFSQNYTFASANFTMLLHFAATFAMIFLVSLYLQYNQGFTPEEAGLIMLIQPVCTMVVAPFAGRLSDKVDPSLLSMVGMVITCVPLVMFIFLGETTSAWYVRIGMGIFGLGVGVFASPNTNAIMTSAPRRYLGVASGMQGTMRSVGQILGMGVVLILFSVYSIGQAEITPEKYPIFLASAKMAFVIFAIINFVGALTPLTTIREKLDFKP